MSVIRSQSNLLKLWDAAGPGYAGRGIWGRPAPPPPVIVQAWNPLDKAAQITLSPDNLTATMGAFVGDYRAVRALLPLGAATKRYWEISIVATGGPSPIFSMLGIMFATATLNGYVGQGPGDYGYAAAEGCRYDNSVNSFPFPPGSWATATAGDVFICATDTNSFGNNLWWGKNGTWYNAGDPFAGTGPVGAALMNHYPATSLYSVGAQEVANFTGPFIYTPPVGFSGW